MKVTGKRKNDASEEVGPEGFLISLTTAPWPGYNTEILTCSKATGTVQLG